MTDSFVYIKAPMARKNSSNRDNNVDGSGKTWTFLKPSKGQLELPSFHQYWLGKFLLI